MGGGGTVVQPVAPIESNEAEIALLQAMQQQNELFLKQQMDAQKAQDEAYLAELEQNQLLKSQKFKEELEKLEREQRTEKEKKDLLYWDYQGIEEEDDPYRKNLLLLGGE